MENASKALLIAGAVLIGVMVLSLIIYVVVSGGEFLLSSTNNESNEIKTFNNRFVKYESNATKKTSGTEIKQLFKDVDFFNKDDDETNDISLNGLSKGQIRNNKEYNVSLGYSEETGRVNSVYISE